MKAIVKLFIQLAMLIVFLSGLAVADDRVHTGTIQGIDMTENKMTLSDSLFLLSRFTVVQYEGDPDERRRPLSLLKLNQQVEVSYKYEHYKIRKVSKIIILSNQ